MLFKAWGAFLYYKIFVHKFFLAMCTCAQKFLGRVHMRIRVVSTKKAYLLLYSKLQLFSTMFIDCLVHRRCYLLVFCQIYWFDKPNMLR